MLSLLSEVNAAVCERSRVTLNTLLIDFRCCGTRFVKLSRLKSHDTIHALGEMYFQLPLCTSIQYKNAFPSPLIRINPFSHKSKTTSSERNFLFSN